MTRLSHLRALYDERGPLATVYLDSTRTTETGDHEVELRWAAQRAALEEAGAPRDVIEALEPSALRPTGVPGGTTTVLVGGADGLLFESVLPLRMPERASWALLPDLAPLVVALGRTAPYVLVHLDRTGADIDVVGPLGETQAHETVQGGTHHGRKVNAGGWSQKRYQQRAENLWEENADQVAAELDRILAETGIEILAVTGDTQVREKLADALGQRGRAAYVPLESGGRGAGSSEEAVREELGRVLAAHVTRQSEDPVSRFREQTGAGHGAALSGRAAVVEALQKGQVDALLVTPDLDDDSTLYVGASPEQLATSEADLAAMGVEGGQAVRADAALVAAAVATDAGVVVVPKGRIDLTDGVGALLRYADATSSS
ncbi:hypothetical protein EV189_2550 [Motilibacter rhizosphaerae]|uniref:Peptide subunit release factor 1 (ERF1) n=1 Tax=Motilibacter rhizosphaerae TaxID=598652 RepID=A0A4V2F4C5_9ACTN|nr:Vms1/Ankzf1 family peptidyl-tRNA hydrolase [Motilibacter rhizosphaerae]RZS87127.1 hypothetical protein EV189_2550 [Motilibacter rhizosphaerae]